MENKLSDYSVKSVKTFDGMEETGFNANLYRGSKKIASVIDSGDGGETNVRWLDHGSGGVVISGRNFSGGVHVFRGTPEEKNTRGTSEQRTNEKRHGWTKRIFSGR